MSNIKHLLAAVDAQLANPTAVIEMGHDIGHALPALDDAELTALGNHLVQIEAPEPQAEAALSMLVGVIDGYRIGRQRTVTLSLREGVVRDVLCELEKRSMSTSDLAHELDVAEPQVSRAIAKLEELDLLDPPQRDAVDQRRWTHHLSLTAKQSLGQLGRSARKDKVWFVSTVKPQERRIVSVDDEDQTSFEDSFETSDDDAFEKMAANAKPIRKFGAGEPVIKAGKSRATLLAAAAKASELPAMLAVKAGKSPAKPSSGALVPKAKAPAKAPTASAAKSVGTTPYGTAAAGVGPKRNRRPHGLLNRKLDDDD
jgi:DNA-binding MarR family transcriptional regulator